jgi:hypothetical protein
MREAINNNPMVQIALVGFLVVAAGFFFLSSSGGGKEEESSGVSTTEPTTVSVGEAGGSEVPAEGVTPVPALPPQAAASAPPPPPAVVRAFNSNQTVAILFVRNGGIDDRLVRDAADRLESESRVSFFTVPASRIARYASIAQGVAVDRVPALVVIRPKKLAGDIPQASVQHGFQSSDSIVQAVVDARYKGRTLDYHP